MSTNKSIKTIPRAGSSLKDKLYLPAIFAGMKITFRHFFTNLKDTSKLKNMPYPEVEPTDITPVYRGLHRLTLRDDDTAKCVACFMCATYCPAECIHIEAVTRDDGVVEKQAKVFTIDLIECVFCGLCVEACPCDAIRMDTGIYSFGADNREDFLMTKDKLMNFTRSDKFPKDEVK